MRSEKYLKMLNGAVLLLLSSVACSAEIDSVVLHPIFARTFACVEHYEGQLKELGDALGTDCWVLKFEIRGGRGWLRPFKADGNENGDWYGWAQEILAPFNGKVVKINVNSTINKPGILGEGSASYIVLERADGLNVMLAHVDALKVGEGETVKAGQVLARVGNNGQAWHPHIHVGVWKGLNPLQVRWDQRIMAELHQQQAGSNLVQ